MTTASPGFQSVNVVTSVSDSENKPNEHQIETYLYGKCMYLAAALNEAFGMEINAVITDGPGSGEIALDDFVVLLAQTNAAGAAYVGHAWAVDGDGDINIDVDGRFSASRNGYVTESDPVVTGISSDSMRGLLEMLNGKAISEEEWRCEVDAAKALVEQYREYFERLGPPMTSFRP